MRVRVASAPLLSASTRAARRTAPTGSRGGRSFPSRTETVLCALMLASGRVQLDAAGSNYAPRRSLASTPGCWTTRHARRRRHASQAYRRIAPRQTPSSHHWLRLEARMDAQARALALRVSNSDWLIAPASRRDCAVAIWSLGPDDLAATDLM